MSASRIRLLLETSRHLSAAQLARRTQLMLRNRWWRLRRTPAPRIEGLSRRDGFRATLVPGDEARGRDVLAGRFEFVGLALEQPTWSDARASKLWRYHLHYFDYLHDLAARPREAGYARFRELARSWIRENATLTGDGWHPYPASLRIVNWCEAGEFFARELDADGDFARLFHASLAGQASFVAANLETDVRGNHLLKNLRGLITAGAYFGESRWMNKGLRVLEREVAEQVLPDGGHFERTPAYHVQVMNDLRSIAALLEPPPQWLSDAIARMDSYLRAIVPPNGRLPLIKDTTLGENDWRDGLSARQRRAESPSLQGEPSRFLPDSGFAVIRDDVAGDHLIADFGKPCPDYLPAHAHADTFSFELTVDHAPLIVDSGVFEYAPGQWREWFRSTAAHNTVEVEGENSSEVWGSFRVARRARIRNVHWLEQEDVRVISGEHDGYTRLNPPVVHRRTIVAVPGAWLIADELYGRGTTRARSRIHLDPERTASDLNLIPLHAAVMHERGWYSEHFGVKRENDVVALDAAGAMPLLFGYCVAPAGAEASLRRDGDDVLIMLATPRTRVTVIVPRHGAPRIA